MAQLLSNLPVGAKVKFGKHKVGNETPWDIIWLIVAKSHTGYPANSVTLLSNEIIDEKAFDANEPTNPDSSRKTGGHNKYGVSNIDQWLNSSSTAWYYQRHEHDTPPSAEYLNSSYASLAYTDKNGFLYNFSTNERNAILATTIRNAERGTDSTNYIDFARKVFIPSIAEIAGYAESGVFEGSKWEWFVNNPSLQCRMYSLTENNLVSPEKPTSLTYNWNWLTRTASTQGNGSDIYYVQYDGSLNIGTASRATMGVRPALNLSSTLKVSDTTDSDGCYTFILNAAPIAPTELYAPSPIYGGKVNSISWNQGTDTDGDTLTYQLECSVDKGNFTQIYKGTYTTYSHLVEYGSGTVQYRVMALCPRCFLTQLYHTIRYLSIKIHKILKKNAYKNH